MAAFTNINEINTEKYEQMDGSVDCCRNADSVSLQDDNEHSIM